MLKFFLKGAVIYFHTYKEKLVEWKQIVFIEVKGNKVTKVTFPFTLGKAILDIFTEININRKKDSAFCQRWFLWQGIRNDKPSWCRDFPEGKTKLLQCFRSHQNHFYFLMNRMSSPNCLLLLWITFTSLKTFFWVKAYDFNIYSPDKIRVYIVVLSALSSAISFWDLMVALISAERAKFSDLSLLTSIRSES